MEDQKKVCIDLGFKGLKTLSELENLKVILQSY